MSNPTTDLHYGKTPLTPSHGDSLVDQSFQSLKSKEIRDSLSPTHEVKFRNSGGIAGGVLVPDTTGWDVQTSSEVSPDGRAFRTETRAKTDGVEKLPGGHAEFAGRNEHKSSASHQGDDKNYVKKAAESSKTHLQEKVVIGDENSGRTEVKSSSMTSSSKVTSSSSQQVFTSDDPGFDMEPRRLTHHQDQQHYQNMLQAANNSSNTVHSERQQFSRNERNERNERQETSSNIREESKKYIDMDKASPEYQQHVQYLMSQPGAIVSNTVEYPKPGVKMITTVKKLPDGTTVKTKRYETEASAADNQSISQTMRQQQQQRTTSSTSTSQKTTEQRIQDSEDVFTRLARTRDSNVPSNAGPRRAPETPSTDDIHSRLQQSRDQKFTDSIDQRSTQILRDTNQPQQPGSRNAPLSRRPSDLVDNVEMISTTNKTVKKDLNQSVRSEKITSSDFIQNERDRYIHDQDRPSRPGPDGYPEALAPITPNRYGRPSQPSDDQPSNGYNATEVIKQSSSTKTSAKFSESRRYSTETVESYQDSLIDNQDHTTRGYPSNRRPIDERSGRSPSGGRPDFSTHGFPSVRSDKPTQQYPTDRPRPEDDYTTSTERVHIIHTDRPRPGDAGHPDSTTTTRSNYSTNETRRHVTSTKEDFSTHGFPSVRAGTPTRDSPRRPLGSEPSPGESPRRPSGQEPPAHQTRRPPSDGYSTHGFPSVKANSPTEDSPRRPSSGPEPTNQGRRPTTEDFSTHGFPSVKPGRSTPTQSSPQYETPNRVDREDTVSVTSDRSNSVIYEKKIDAAHAAFARSLRCASPVESPRRDSTSDRHTPRSSIGSIRNSYSPSKSRDGRSPSHDSVTNSESSRISSATVTKTHRPTEVRRVSHPKSPIGKSSPSHVSNETIDLTLTRKITAKPSPDKTPTSRPTPGSTPNTSRRVHKTNNTEEDVETLLDTATKHITTTTTHPSIKTTPRSSKTQDTKPKQQPETLSSKKPSIVKPEGYITLNEANAISEKHNLTTNKHVSYPHYIPTGPKADRSPSDIRSAPQSTTPHNNAPKSTKDKVKSPSTTTSSPSPRSTSPLKVDNSTSRFTKTVNRDTNTTTTKTKLYPEFEPESDREPEPESIDEGYVPDRKGKTKPNSRRPTSDDEGFEPDSPRAGSPASDFEYRRPEQVETFDEEDSIVKKTRRTDKKVVTNDFLETERNVTRSRRPEEPVDESRPINDREGPKRPDREGRKPSNLAEKPTGPRDHKQPEDEEPKQRRPKDEDSPKKWSPNDRKPSQLTDEPRNEPDQPERSTRKPSQPKEPKGSDDKPSRPVETSRPRGTKPPLERSETFEERCRQILGMDSETVVDQTKHTKEFIETEQTTVDSKRRPSDRSPSPDKKQPSDKVSIEDCNDDDNVKTRPKYPSKTTTTSTTTIETTREHPRDKSPLKKGPDSKPSDDYPHGRYPEGKLPKQTSSNETDVTTTTVYTTKITDDRPLSPERKSPKKNKPVDVSPRDRSPLGRYDETTAITKTTKIVDESDEPQVPKDQSPQRNQPKEKAPTTRRTPSPQKKQPSDIVSIEDCEEDDSNTTKRTTSINKTTREKPEDRSPIGKTPRNQSPGRKLPKENTTTEYNEKITTTKTTKITDDRSPSPKRKSPKDIEPLEGDRYPKDRSPSGKPQKVDETTIHTKSSKIVDEIDEQTTHSKPRSHPKDDSSRETRPTDKSPEYDSETEITSLTRPRDRSPSDKRTFITTRETTFDVESTSDIRSSIPEKSPTEPSSRNRSPAKQPGRETRPSDKSPRGRSPTDETILTTTTTHSTTDTDGITEDRYPSYTPKSFPSDRSPVDKQKPKTIDKKETTVETSNKTKETTTEEIYDDVFETKRPRERQPDTRDGSYFSQPRDQSPSEPGTYRPKTEDYPRDRSPEKETTEEIERITTKRTSNITSDTTIEDETRPKGQPRDRSPNKPTKEDTHPTPRSNTNPRDQYPIDDLTRPSTTKVTETRRVDKTSVINDFLDTERQVDRPRRPEEDKPSQPRNRSPNHKPRGPTDLDESTVTKTTKKTKETKITDEVEELSPSSHPRDRSPTEKPIRSPRIVTTETTTEYGIGSRPRSESPEGKPKKPVDFVETDETVIQKITKITEDLTITTDLDDDIEKPGRRPQQTTNKVYPRDKSPQKSKPSDSSRSPLKEPDHPQTRSPTEKEPKTTNKSPRGRSPTFTYSTDEETNLVSTSKTTKLTSKTENVDFEGHPRRKSPTQKPKGSRPTDRSPIDSLRGSYPTEKPEDHEPTDSDYEETLIKRTNKTTRNETSFEEKIDRSPRNYPEDKPRDKSPSKPSGQKPTDDSDNEYPKGPSGKPRPRESSPDEISRKPVFGEETIVQTTSIKTTTQEDRSPKFPSGSSPTEKSEPKDYPRDRSPTEKRRKPHYNDTVVEITTTESTTVKDHLAKGPRGTSPSEKPESNGYPRDRSPTEKPRKPKYDETLVEQTTTESTTVMDRSTKSPRGSSPSERSGPRNYPRDRSPDEKPRKPRYDETLVERITTESTTVKDCSIKSPRGSSPSERSGPRDYPRDRSPTEKPRKPRYDETLVEQTTIESTTVKDRSTKSPRGSSPSDKLGTRDYPLDRSPNQKPRKPTYEETSVEQITTESTTVKDRSTKSPRGSSPSERSKPKEYPRDRSPNEKLRKPRYDETLVEQITTESTTVKDRSTKSPRGSSPSDKSGPRDYPRDRSPNEKPRKPTYEQTSVEEITTESTTVKDRSTKSPRGSSPSERSGPRNYPRDRSPNDTTRYDETVIEKTTTAKNRPTKSPRGSSPSERTGPREYPRDKSPNEKPRKPRYDETVVETTTTESTTIKDRLTKSPRESSPTEKPKTRDYSRERSPTNEQYRPRGLSPTEKPERKRPTDDHPVDDCCPEHQPRDKSPLGKPKGFKPTGDVSVIKRTTKTTTVDNYSSTTPRGSSPTKSSPRERSPTQKPSVPKGSPRTTSPTEKPGKRQPIVNEYGKTVQKITSKFNKDIKTTEKIVVKDHPRRKSPSEKPRRGRPTTDDDTDDETTETIIAVYTIDGETVEDRPRDLSPKSSPKRPQTNGHSDLPRDKSPTEKPRRHQPTDEEIEESFNSTSRITKNREVFEKTSKFPTRDQPRDKSPISRKPRGRQPTDESIDVTVVQTTRRTNKDESSVVKTQREYPEDSPRDRSPSGRSPHRSYPRDSSPQNKSPLREPNTTEETILYTTEVTTKITDSPRDRSPSDKPRERYPTGKPETKSYPRDRSPSDKPGPKTYPRDKSPSDKPSRPRAGYVEETNRTTTTKKTVQETDLEKRYPKSRPGNQSPSEKPSTLRRPSKLSTTTTTTTTRNRSSLDEQDINKTQRPRTQPSTREKLPTKTTPLSSPRTQPSIDRRVPAELPSPSRKPKPTFGVTTKTTTTTVTKSTGVTRPKPTTETPKKPLKFPLESRPGARPTERTPQSISPDSSPSRGGSDFEIDSSNMSPSRKTPSPTRSVKLEDITTTFSTTKKTTMSTEKSKPKVTHVSTAKIQITPPTSPTKVISSPEVKLSPSAKKPSSRVPTSKPSGRSTTQTTTTKKVTSKLYKDGIIPTDSEERDSEIPSDTEEVDTPSQQRPSSRKLPVTERKESAPVHRVTKINKDVQMSRSTSENLIKTPITRRTGRQEPLEPRREVPSSRPTVGDRSSPKSDRRPSKHLSTKTINLSTFDKVINSEDMENVVIDIQHAKSSREPSPNKIVPTPVAVDTYTGKPRYPDVVQEPEDEPKKKPVVKNIPIFEEETNDFVGCQITEVNEETHENTVKTRTTKFIEKEASPHRQTPKIVTGDNVDSECLLSVHDKVSKFITTAEEVSKPKTSAPFRRDLPEQDMPEDDECLLTVDEKVSKFLKTADSVTKEVITSKPRRVERPSIADLDDDLKTDECVLSVSEKVNKFTTKAEKLAPTAPQRSPELVARIERQISRQSDVEPESPESEDSPASVRKFKPNSPLTDRTERKYTERQIDILSRPSVWEKKPKPDVKLDDIISVKPEEEPRNEVPQKSKPLKTTDSVSKRKELFESKVSTNKTTLTTKETSPEKRPTRPSKYQTDRRPSDVSDSKYPNEFQPRYVDGYPQQELDDDVHEDVYGSSKTRRVYETSSRETTTVLRSPDRSPTRKTNQPESRPTTHTTNKSPRQPDDKNPSRRYSEDHSPRPRYPNRDQPSTDRYEKTTHESSENTTRRRSSTQEYTEHRTPYNGSPRSPLRKQPIVEPEDLNTFSSRRDETTTHYTTRTVPHSPKDSPLTPTSFLDEDEEHDHSPARSTSTVSSHKQITTHRTTSSSKRVTEDTTARRPRRPSGNEPGTPTTPGSRTPRTRAVPETVAARRNIFEQTSGNVSPMPTGRKPSYMEPTKSSLEHRKDSLELTKTNFSRKSSVDEEPYEPSPRTSVKFGVGLKHKEEPKPKRKLSSSDIPNIEDVFELELLEEMLNVVSSYEQRRRIRAQIRIVKKLLETKTKEEVSRMTKITTIRKASSSSVRESPTPRKETPVRPSEKFQLTDDDIDSESIVESHHIEEREEIIRERSISPQTKTSRIVTKVTEVRKVAEPSPATNKRTPLKKDEPKDSKPIWATKNILKKPSENEKVTRALSAKKTTSTTSSSMSRTQQQTSRQRVAIDDDCVTSSYGIGPTDEDGRPLFGIRALKKKTNTTNNAVQPSETTKVTGTVITEKYYSENGAEPVGERKVTVYSTNPDDLVDMETEYDRRGSETVKREKLSKDGLTTVTKVQKIGKYTPGEIPSLTDDSEPTKTSSKMVRRGSVKEMSEKFIRKESSSSVTEKSSGYPKAGLILRTRRNSGATADTADQYEARARSIEHDYDSEEDVEIRTSRKHSKVVTESEDETEIRRKVNTRSFLNSAGSKVTGVDDVLERMRNADNVEVDGDTMEDREARSLLNKFLGASVLMSGMESMIPQMELRKTTSGADNKQEVKTTRVTKTIKSGTTGGSSSSPVARETCDFEEIWDEEILKQLLEKSTSYEERRSIRARLRQLMADREGQSTTTTEKTETKKEDGGVVTTTTKVTTRTITGASKPVSPFAKFQQLDKQSSLQSPKSPSTPTTPGGSSTTPIFRFTDPALNARAATFKEQLLQWCQSKTQEYENVQITNFSASWTDGLAFCALIHHFLPDAFDYSKLTPKQRRYNFELAFRVADEKAGIAPLLDVEDMVVMKRPDWKCVFTYVQSIYRRFRNCQ